MKQLYKVFPVLLTVGLFGCDDVSLTQKSKLNIKDREVFVSKLPDSAPVFKVAVADNLPPFSFQDDYGNVQGFDIDSMRAIGEEQGFKVDFYKEKQKDILAVVASGSRDIGISGIFHSEELDSKYGLSKPYFFNPAAIMYAKSELNIKELDDLKGLRVGALEGSRQADSLKYLGDNIELIPIATSFLSYENLLQDKVDAIVGDSYFLEFTAKNHPEHPVVIVPYEEEDDITAQQVVVTAKDDKALIADINKGITKLKERDTFKEIQGYWIDLVAE